MKASADASGNTKKIQANKIQPKARSNNMAAEEKKRMETPMGEAKESTMDDMVKPQFSAADLSGGNLDKIREILFGTQARGFEKRLTRLEERLIKETTDLREDLKKRFDSLEAYIKKEAESLSDRLKIEERERAENVSDLSRELKDSTRNLEKRLAQLDDQVTKNNREINQQLADRSRSLADEIRQKYEELSALLEREAEELRVEKTDRAMLAALFTEVALRLNNEFKIPGGE